MIASIAIYQLVETFVNALAADKAVNDYCQAQFGTDVTLYIGYNGKSLPAAANCPYIIIYPDLKVEGADEQLFKYTISVDWAVSNATQTTSGKVVALTGVGQCDALGQLILECLNKVSAGHPLASISYRIAATKAEAVAKSPLVAGEMKLTVNMERPIGMQLSYP